MTPILDPILSLPAYDLEAITLLHQHQAGIAIDWTTATQALQALRIYTDACAELTKTITRLAPSPATDADLLLTTLL